MNKKFDNVKYTGVDISESMVTEAKKLHPELNIQLRNVFEDALVEHFNVVTANGIFYLLGKNSLELMKEFVSKMFDMADELVVFNSLSTWAGDQEESEFYADPAVILEYCRTLSPWVSIRHDYHPRDFTIYLYKNRNL